MRRVVRRRTERWRPIPSLPGYLASDHGRIKTRDRLVLDQARWSTKFRRERICKLRMDSGRLTFATFGLLGTNLDARKNKAWTRKVAMVGRAVLEAFCRPGRPREYAHHRDGDRSNNALDNLEWRDRPRAKMTMYVMGRIRVGRSEGRSCAELAAQYGITLAACRAAASEEAWRLALREHDRVRARDWASWKRRREWAKKHQGETAGRHCGTHGPVDFRIRNGRRLGRDHDRPFALMAEGVDVVEELSGRRPSIRTLAQWATRGCAGVRLRTVSVARCRMTTRAWLVAFWTAVRSKSGRT